MAITKSAKKALRQGQRRRKRNLIYKTKIKALLKKARDLAASKESEDAKNLLPSIYKALDKGAKIGVIKKNAASRQKSRIAKLLDSKL